MKKCRKWEPIARSATISISFKLKEFSIIEEDRRTCPAPVAATSVYETSLHAMLPLCARGRLTSIKGCGRIGMRTERQRRRPWQTGCRRLAGVDRPSLGGARPPYTRAHPSHPQRTSTSYFDPACCAVIRSQVTRFKRAVTTF